MKSTTRYLCFSCSPKTGEIDHICEHLELLLPHETGKSIRAVPVADVNRLKTHSRRDMRTQEEKELEFRNKLFDYGLDETSANLLTLKFVYNWPLKDICDYLHLEPMVAHGIYKKAIEVLRERGYRA